MVEDQPIARRAVVRLAQRRTDLASVRYRGLLPACALQDLGWGIEFSSPEDAGVPTADLAIAVKPLLQSESDWAQRARHSGMPLVMDLCDNIFVEGYGAQNGLIAERFRKTVPGAIVTVPTEAMRQVVIRNTSVDGARVLLVPDIVETPSLLRRQRAMIGQSPGWPEVAFNAGLRGIRGLAQKLPGRRPILVWFGNHGADYGNFGLSDLLLFADALHRASVHHGAQLWIMSNHRQRYEAVAAKLPIRSRYFEWSVAGVEALLVAADVCLVPNSLDAFSRTKSANRALKALSAGVPVVATATPAYDGLESAVWLANPADGVVTYLEDAAMREVHLGEAQRLIDRDHSMPALRSAMTNVLDVALEKY